MADGSFEIDLTDGPDRRAAVRGVDLHTWADIAARAQHLGGRASGIGVAATWGIAAQDWVEADAEWSMRATVDHTVAAVRDRAIEISRRPAR